VNSITDFGSSSIELGLNFNGGSRIVGSGRRRGIGRRSAGGGSVWT